MICQVNRDQDDNLVAVLAPNGNPSKLFDSLVQLTNGNKEDALKLWVKVKTPEFKSWFGDWENDPKNSSKVVDENGEPLIVYHGTKNVFEEFNNFNPVHFGTLESSMDLVEQKYALFEDSEKRDLIKPFFLNVRNVKETEDLGNNQAWYVERRASSTKGFNGFKYVNTEEAPGDVSYAVFEPNQIKSVYNRGTFDETSNNINESRDIEGEKEKVTQSNVKELVEKLAKRFNIRVVWDSNIPAKGMFYQGVVTLNPNKITLDTPFHEFAHPFIDAVRVNNPALYKQLRHEILNSAEGKKIIKQVREAYPELKGDDIVEEAIVTLIGLHAADRVPTNALKQLIRKLLETISSYVRELINSPRVKVTDLKATTTFEELGYLFALGTGNIEVWSERRVEAEKLVNTIIDHPSFVLTGSQAISKQGVIVRPSDEVHDIDFLVKMDEAKGRIDSLRDEILAKKKLSQITKEDIKNQSWYKFLVSQYPEVGNYEIITYTDGLDRRLDPRKDKVIEINFSMSRVIDHVSRLVRTNINGFDVDFFVTNEDVDSINGYALSKNIFNIKEQYGREKDMVDIANYKEFGPRYSKEAPPAKKYSVPSARVTVEDMVKRIKDVLKLQEAIYEDKAANSTFIERVKNMRAFVENANSEHAIVAMIEEAGHWVESLEGKMEQIVKLSSKKERLTEAEIHEVLKLLDETKNFAGAYTILDDMVPLLRQDPSIAEWLDFKKDVDGKSGVRELVAKRNFLMSQYLDYSLDAMTHWVYPYVERANANLREKGRADLQLSWEDIRDRFRTAPKDIGFLNGALGAAINSSDEINSLIAMAIKNEMEKARLKDINIQNDILEVYLQQDGPKNNPKEFNKGFYRSIKLPDGTTNVGLIQEIDEDRFYEAKSAFLKKLGDKPDKSDKQALNKFYEAQSRWFTENTELRPDHIAFAEKKKNDLGKEFPAWLRANTRSVGKIYAAKDRILMDDPDSPEDNVLIYTGEEFIRPSKAKYGNKNFDTIIKNPLFKKLYDTYKEANETLPLAQRLRFGMVPQIPKSGFDGMLDNGLDISGHLERVKEGIKRLSPDQYQKDEEGNYVKDKEGNKIPISGELAYIDTQYGRKGLQTLSGENLNYLPIYYNKKLDQNEVSLDLVSSVLLFSQMANNYKSMHNIMPHVNTVTSVVLGSPAVQGSGRKVVKTSSVGQVVNAITGNFLIKDTGVRVNDRLKAFIDSVYWGQQNVPMEITLFGKTLNVDKFLDSFGMLNAFSTMTGNILGGISNTIIANYNSLNESFARKYYNTDDWLWGQKEYAKLTADGTFISDLTKVFGKSKISQLIELYDVIQGEFKDQYGRKISGNAAKRAFSTSTAFFINNVTEHQAQVSGFLGFLHATKLKDAKGAEISLYDAYEISNNRLKLKEGIVWPESKRQDVMNKIHGLSKELNGNYNSFDRSVIQRNALGRLALMFRKHIYTGYQRRWATEYIDFEQGTSREGYYKTFGKMLIRELKAKRFNVLLDWSTLSADERAAFRQSLFDMILFTTVAFVYGMLDDDEIKDNSQAQNHAMLQLRRFMADMKFYFYFNADIARLMKTPAVTMDFMGKVIDWMDYMFFTWDPVELEYQRQSGANEKGDSKTWAKFYKLAPGLRGIRNFQNPEDQLTVFRDK